MTRQIAQGKSAQQIQAERARQARRQQAAQQASARKPGTQASSSSQRPKGSQKSSAAKSNGASKKGKGRTAPSSKKPKGRRPGFFSWLIALASIAGLGWFIDQLVRINILPGTMLVGLCAALAGILFLLVLIWLFRTRRSFTKAVMAVLVAAIGSACALGGYYLKSTDTMFEQVTNLTDKQANTVTVYAMKETNITAPDQIKAGMVLGIDPSDDPQGTQGMVEALQAGGAVFETRTFENCFTLVDALYDHKVDAVIFPENVHAELYEQANDDNKYNALTTFTNVVDQYVYYTARDQNTINRPDPVSNIMLDPFTVLVSGNDSYGSINQITRSDVNMLVTVNPRTAQVLILSIPRDSYLEISCRKNPNVCSAVSGQPDKLTHSGLYGVGATETTLEDAFDVEINYYARINFSSLINIIDAIGGIDVNVEPGLEVERFYANGTEGVHAGINHLEGERALAFVRERHAYVDGDNQRIRNQQIVLRALLKALLSPQMVVNYPKVMTALSTAFDTNMTSNEIKSLLTLELSRFPKWNIQTYSLAGEPQTDYSPSAQAYLSVMMLSQQSIATAKALIDEVINGQTLHLDISEPAALPVQNTYDPSAYEESYVDSDPVIEPAWGQDDVWILDENSVQDEEEDNAIPAPYGRHPLEDDEEEPPVHQPVYDEGDEDDSYDTYEHGYPSSEPEEEELYDPHESELYE